ncbi:MAG: cytochrome c [Actinomycetota bacterium]|nr:cytochrome c [Actinomycetota bacterium]
MPARTAALLAATSVGMAGCASAGTRPGPERSAVGRMVFATSCRACHSLSGASSARQQGGDLLDVHLRRPVLLQFTAEMPVRRRLHRAEVEAVVDYVLAVQRQSR